MVNLVYLLVTVLAAISLRSMLMDKSAVAEKKEDVVNGPSWSLSHYLSSLADTYGIPFGQHLIYFIYGIYLRLTFLNLVVFLLKYVPTAVYMYKFVKSIYVTSRERLKLKQTELEDIQLEIQIVNTKLCVREAEFNERADILRRENERLRRVRARVREVIAADTTLRRTLEAAADCDEDLDMHYHVHTNPQEDSDFITELLKELKSDKHESPDRFSEKKDSGEYASLSDSETSPDHSVYSSLSDLDLRQDCQVKIVKVTNVYKVAYLKHYIKQKRLRRANKRALLKKRMENIKKPMEDWQKALSMVTNRNIMNMDMHPIDVASQEAMGDYSKPRESSSDSDLRNDYDSFYEECSFSWPHNPYRPYSYSYEEVPETARSREYYSDQDIGDVKHVQISECIGQQNRKMHSIEEETGSQMTMEDITSEADYDGNCRDLVAI